MIVGCGLVASGFRPHLQHDADTVVFASGVSNSKETDSEQFLREESLLDEFLTSGRRIFYFGSCSVLDPTLQETPYVRHKLRMEQKVREVERHAIFRLPQVVGKSKNPNLLTNFLYEKIKSGDHFQVWKNARRNLIDVEDVASIALGLANDAQNSATYNLASPNPIFMKDIVQVFERVLNKNAVYSIIDAGAGYDIEVNQALCVARSLGIDFDNGYVQKIIGKYYG